jgi:hypothetical protein
MPDIEAPAVEIQPDPGEWLVSCRHYWNLPAGAALHWYLYNPPVVASDDRVTAGGYQVRFAVLCGDCSAAVAGASGDPLTRCSQLVQWPGGEQVRQGRRPAPRL